MIEATSDSFQEETSTGRVLVDFHGQSCAPCRAMGMILKNCEQELEEKCIRIVKVDINECPDIAEDFGVSSIPAICILENGERVDGFVGMRTKGQIMSVIDGALR